MKAETEGKTVLNERNRRFVRELLAGASATQAAIAAGYSEKSAASQASRLLKNKDVIAYRRQAAKEIYDALGITAESLALELEEIKRRCMEAEPHLSWDPDARAYLPDGTWIFNAKGAIAAIKTQAEMMGVTAPSMAPQGVQELRVEIVGGKQGYGE